MKSLLGDPWRPGDYSQLPFLSSGPLLPLVRILNLKHCYHLDVVCNFSLYVNIIIGHLYVRLLSAKINYHFSFPVEMDCFRDLVIKK